VSGTGLRVALATDWFAPRRGGIETQLLQLADGLGARGHAVDVLTTTPGAADGERHRVRALDVPTLPIVHVAASPTLLDTLAAELGRGYDVVHAHVSVVSPVGYAAAAVARALGVPTVVTFHSVLRLKRHALAAASALMGAGRDSVVWSAVSTTVAAQARDGLGTNVSLLPNGIDLGFWRNGKSREPGSGITLVSTMRLHRKKRPRELLRAFARAAEGGGLGVRARLVLVGDGPERGALERDIARLALTAGREGGPARVELTGWMERESLRDLYRSADGFVLASTREAFGIAALEARAAGLPVIAMAASGSSDFLTDGVNALVCADDEALERALVKFLSDRALRERLTLDSSATLERYDWSAILAAHEDLYRGAIARVPREERAGGP
jgi:glycosyltransferase involved in cell wall biosynthesis